MEVCFQKSILNGIINAPMSKSDLHRKLICSALSDNESKIYINGEISDDIKSTVNCLNSMGAKINVLNNYFRIKPIDFNIKSDFTLNCNESGSTLRFLLPVAAALGGNFTVTGKGRLPERPLNEHIKLLTENGCKISGDKLPIKVEGKLTGNYFEIDGSVSSQYISGILLASPLINENCIVKVKNNFQSKNYVDITIKNMTEYGCHITNNGNTFIVNGKYHSKNEIFPESDWSNSAFFLTAGAINNDLTVKGLNLQSLQGDRKIMEILKNAGISFKIKNDLITIKKSEIKPIVIDAAQIPDLVPIIAVLLSFAKGKSHIMNAERLRLKESDRLYTTTKALNNIGANIIEHTNSLEINGIDKFTGGYTDSFNDHRIAMAVAIAALNSENDVYLKNAEAINKSYPDFYNIYNTAGGKCNVIYNGK